MTLSTFALASVDEIWVDGVLVERRLSHGRAEQAGTSIVAVDARDDLLVARAVDGLHALRDSMPQHGRVHLVSRASTDGDEATMTVTVDGLSLVLEGGGAAGALPPLSKRRLRRRGPYVLWHNGSGSILLHEAFGHAREHNKPDVEWPAWLRIDAPLKLRRESFKDVPLLRMTNVVVTHDNAPFDPPDDRIDVEYVRGGAYDPLTDMVTIEVAVPQFTIRATREQIARSIAGAHGETVRYPGVICSREGQQLVVGSFAPTLLTVGLT